MIEKSINKYNEKRIILFHLNWSFEGAINDSIPHIREKVGKEGDKHLSMDNRISTPQ